MKFLIVWISSLLLAGIMISPFFWLKFLKKRSVWGYIVLSSFVTLVIFVNFIFWGDDYIRDLSAKINADLYYTYYDVGFITIMLIHLLIVLSPFVITKIAFGEIRIKSFIISLLFSILILITYALVFIYILLPKAFSELNRRL